MAKTPSKQNNSQKPKQQLSAYGRYSGIAFQTVIIVILGGVAGNQLDKYFETEKPWWTLGLSFFTIILSLYLLIKKVMDQNKS